MILRTLAGLVLRPRCRPMPGQFRRGDPGPESDAGAGASGCQVVLISDAAGWGAREEAMPGADGRGAIVVGIDLPSRLPSSRPRTATASISPPTSNR